MSASLSDIPHPFVSRLDLWLWAGLDHSLSPPETLGVGPPTSELGKARPMTAGGIAGRSRMWGSWLWKPGGGFQTLL